MHRVHAKEGAASSGCVHAGGVGTHMFLLFTRPGRPPPKGLVRAKSMCFWLSTRTRKEGTSTTCLPTLQVGKRNRVGGGVSAKFVPKVSYNPNTAVSTSSPEPSCPGSPDVLLADEHTGVVDGLGEALLEHQGLQPSLQHIVGTQGEGIIQLVLGLVQQAVLVQPAHEGLPLENALGVLLIMLQQGVVRLQQGMHQDKLADTEQQGAAFRTGSTH
eukprot:1153714-Pelagomonas_calceolata.AAC.1